MKNIIIAGGGLVNKGAQAMTLISICELKKRYPDHRIFLLTWNVSSEERMRNAIYDFELLSVPPLKFAQAAKNPLKRAAFTLHYGKTFREVDEIYRNTDLLIDISGYALSSNWSVKVCNDYLDNIEYALAYGIPVYLMPQSFGPFDFQDESGKAIDVRIRTLMPQVKLICARETEGYQAMHDHYGLVKNTVLSKDMVLASRINDYSSALRECVKYNTFEISYNSVCLIPNFKVNNTTLHNIQNIYCSIIKKCLSFDLIVYLIYHSTLDIDLCANLKSAFADDDRVVFLEHDHSCIEFNELVKKFRFVVSSRFHAIVHALKNGVPCVALGWAVKYEELMKLFGQEKYVVDLREEISPDDLTQTIEEMYSNYETESRRIQETLPNVCAEKNIFDKIEI